jgi:WD40 repeat protein/tRNA A-37 threonylcarbamoyl transferase component Bud32
VAGRSEGAGAAARKPPCIPGYEILAELGRGGMGVVYKARQNSLNRMTALKMILAGGHAGIEDRMRFRAEAEAAAALQHPHIIQVYEVGEHEGNLFFSMELVEGGSLREELQGLPQPARPAARLVETLARAAQYAHERGIIHRDLKPANILLSFSREPPARAGAALTGGSRLNDAAPKITDFGLAKRLNDVHRTVYGRILGTPSYMAPEQASGRGTAVGPAIDIYALGVLLFELLTGQPPFVADSWEGTLSRLAHEDPVPPRRLQPKVPRDLETICLKCLQKEPQRRYASARELADDLRRFLDGRPIMARPVGVRERAWKWARRHPGLAAMTTAFVLVTLLAAMLLTWKWREAVGNAELAEQNAREKDQAYQSAKRLAEAEAQARGQVERFLVGTRIDQAVTLCERGEIARGMLRLAHGLEDAVRFQDADLERVIRVNLSGWRHALVLKRRDPSSHPNWIWDVAFSPDGKTFLTGSRDKTARLWDAATGLPARAHDGSPVPPLEHPFPVWALAFSRDGKNILTGCGSPEAGQGEARLWEAATGKLLRKLHPARAPVRNVAFNKNGRRLLTLAGYQACIWDSTPRDDSAAQPLLLPQAVLEAVFSPDGTHVLTGGADGLARLWDAATGQATSVACRHPNPVEWAAFAPDSKTAATGTTLIDARQMKVVGAEVGLWDMATGQALGRKMHLPGRLKTLIFSPDGRSLLTSAEAPPGQAGSKLQGEVRLWDAASGEPFGPPLPFPEPVWALAFSPDSRTFVTGCEARFAQLWLTATRQPLGPRLDSWGNVRAAAFSPDGTSLVYCAATEPGMAYLLAVSPGQALAYPIRTIPGQKSLALGPDGKIMLGASSDRRLQLWDLTTGRPLGAPLPAGPKPFTAAFGRDGKTLVIWRGNQVEQWDVATGRPSASAWKQEGEPSFMLLAPDGKTAWLYVPEGDRRYLVRCDLATGRRVGPRVRHDELSSTAQSPDGRLILTAGGWFGVGLWEADTGRRRGRYLQEELEIRAVAFAPSGQMYATGGVNRTAQAWDAATGYPVMPPLSHPDEVVAIAFSSDGMTLATGCRDHAARLWDVKTGKPLSPPLLHRAGETGAGVTALAFVHGGTQLIVAGGDESAPIWDVPAPWKGDPDQVKLEVEVLTERELDARGTARLLTLEEWQKRRQRLAQSKPTP